jgi:dethiobiotin synthetase
MRPLIVTGTDTGIGKTVVSAMLTQALNGVYWKPIQAGNADGTDTRRVKQFTGLGAEHFREERYLLTHPLSPHRAAELDGVEIDMAALPLPADLPENQWLVIEGAGGVLVPVTRHVLQAEIFARWNAPVVLCARTALGTINHSLLSIEALRTRGISILGVVFVGDAMPDSEAIICELGKVTRLGRLPFLPDLNADALRAVFAENFRREDFEGASRP